MKKRIISVNKDPKANKNIKQTSDMLEMEKIMRETEQLLYRIPIFLSIPNRLNSKQQAFVQRLIREIRSELLFSRTLPRTEQYPEPPLTNVRRMMLRISSCKPAAA
ncbi:hypothetical protein [Aneurinibacillus sp. REN35]|uniref:hypothetical protein n=1 Tax=Aneurinibacillus sp. REN35 TaxID=3237286 RepID=UPI003528B3C5